MILNWIKRRVQLAAVNGIRSDLERFVLSLRGQSPEELGMLVAIATVIRLNLRANGHLSDGVLGVGMPVSDADQAATQLRISRLVRQFQKMNQLSDAAGTMVWLHSLRAFNYPEVRLLGRQMWAELERGFPHVFDAFHFIENTTGQSLPPGALIASQFIPEGLEPF